MSPLFWIMEFSKRLLGWYKENARELPWRVNVEPYKVWLSEVIMQQTRIAQGLPYYEKFVNELPSIRSFADADLDTILRFWQGLGYYSRARNMHIASKQVIEEFNGSFPNNFEDLRKLKGVGDYTAAAIASIVFSEPVAVVDGNVYRVLSRVFNIELPIDTNQGKKYFQELANQLIDKSHPGDYNQGVMDFGAMVCTPKLPQCHECVLLDICLAKGLNKIEERPVKSKKIKVKDRFFAFFDIRFDDKLLIEKRNDDDIWKGLYQLPLVEVESEDMLNYGLFENHYGVKLKNVKLRFECKHILTHQRIKAHFYQSEIDGSDFEKLSYLKVDSKEIDDLALPKLVENYLIDLNKI